MNTTEITERLVYAMRQNGQTTKCIEVLRKDPSARMIVGTCRMQNAVRFGHPDVRDRILTIENMESALRGLNVPLVWDNTAVVELVNRAHTEGRSLGQKEGLDVGTSMNIQEREKPVPTVDFDTMKQLANVLKEIADLYNVNVFIVPKPNLEKKND